MKTSCLAGFLVLGVLGAAGPQPTHTDVFISGQDGYKVYRIPAIETAPDGSLVACAEARKYNAADPGHQGNDIDLVCKRSTDGGRTWSAMQVVEDPGEKWSAANPATVVDRKTNRVWVLYLRSKPGRSTRTSRPGTDDMQTFARHSADNGVTWSAPIDLSRVARDYVDATWRTTVVGPGGAIATRSGRLIVPAWKSPYNVFTLASDDHGATWQRGAMAPGGTAANENQLVELADGRVLMDARHTGGPHRFVWTSGDGGATWRGPRPGASVTPCACAIERLTLAAGTGGRNRILWTGPKGPGRTTLVARVSYDEGATFPLERVIATEKAAYSDLTILPDGRVGVLWERAGYRFITFTILTVAWLEEAQKRP
jgi:sialidase-1